MPNDLLQGSALILSASAVVKILIGLLKMAIDPPRWVAPTAALILGPLALLGLVIAQSQPLTSALIAATIINGVMAGAAAVGAASIQDGERHPWS